MKDSQKEYTIPKLNKLTKPQRQAIMMLVAREHPRLSSSNLTSGLLYDALALWAPCESCVPSGYEEELDMYIIQKFSRPLAVACDLVEMRFYRKYPQLKPHLSLISLVEPSSCDATYFVVLDTVLNHMCFYGYRKAWNFQFGQLDDLAIWLLDTADMIYESVENQWINKHTSQTGALLKLTDDTWESNFKPIKNHLDKNASWDGCMFETFGKELEFVKKQDPDRIWTYMDTDDGDHTVICEGFHFVNRIGYFITKRKHFGLPHQIEIT